MYPKTVTFKEGLAEDGSPFRLQADIYIPPRAKENTSPLPVVMWWSGGGWTTMGRGGGGRLMNCVVDAGWALMTIDYRVAASWQGVERPSALPIILADMRAAWQWVLEHGAEYQLDGNSVFLAGDSAGAHLVSLFSMQDGCSQQLCGVLALMPPVDLTDDASPFTVHSRALLGTVPSRCPDEARAASPYWQAHCGTPPHLLIHGLEDQLVPYHQSRRLKKRFAELGVQASMLLLPEVGHDSPAIYGHPASQEAITSFIVEVSSF